MDKSDFINRYKCGERDFKGANLSGVNLSDANLSGANLSEANLGHANLSGANLSGANLSEASFWKANLIGAKLSDADLRGTAFWKANLIGAKLSDADLSYAVLRSANLSEANLRRANLSGADLSCADLSDADLSRTNLNRTKFGDANLRGTVLDPANEFDPLSEEEFLSAGFEVDGGMVVGYRTKRSVICGDTIYISGKTYTAPVFSTDIETECHPGIYLAPLKWVKNVYPEKKLVKVSAKISNVLKCWTKWRAREIVVIEDYEEK